MINENKKEELKQMAIEEFTKRVNEYMEKMDMESNKDVFPISQIETMWGELIEDTKTIIHDLTEETVNEIDEQLEINKKKENLKKEE